jgi:excisionase family DNA binding protein
MSNVVALQTRPINNTIADEPAKSSAGRMSVPDIARRLGIGRLAVYSMLESGIIPGIRVGRRWLITRRAYEQWESTCGTKPQASPTTISGDFTSTPDRGRSLVCQ